MPVWFFLEVLEMENKKTCADCINLGREVYCMKCKRLKNGYKESESGERFVKKEHYYPENMKAELQSAVAANPNTIAQGSGDKGNAIRLEIFYNRQSGKAFVQLFEYVPYKYQPCSDMMEYNLSQIENLIK